MAMQTLQLWLVFAVGFCTGPVPASAGSNRALPIEPAAFPSSTRPNVTLKFVEEPSDVIVVRGQDTQLRCLAESTTGSVTIVWMYENSPVPPEDPRWQINGSELKVLSVNGGRKSVGKLNTGEYSCLARNSFGAILSRGARVRAASMDKEVTIKGTPTVLESQPLYLQCTIHSVPVAGIYWEFNNLPLTKDKRYVPLPNGAFLLRDTKLVDSGNYRCVSTNSILERNRTKDFEVNVILPPEDRVAPSIVVTNTSSNRLLVEGDTVEFICIATGWPVPTVKWINNKNVSISNSSEFISYLTIENANVSDSNNYTCVASNGIERISETINVHVYQKPFFNVTPVSVVSPSAKTVRMDCQAIGIPQPKISWLKDGNPLKPEVRIRKQGTGIVFTHTLSTDTGIYQCVAANPVGKVWSTAQIEINNSQSPSPPENVQCRPYDEDKICLTWKNPPNVSVKAYSIYSSYINSEGLETQGQEYLNPVDPTKIAEQPYQLAKDLNPNINYTFFVRLYTNKASDYAKKVTCQPAKGKRNLEIDTINHTALVLKWSEISSDVLCNGTRDPYVVQWHLDESSDHVFTGTTLQRNFSVFGLLPGTDYCINVVTLNSPKGEPCTLYTMPSLQSEENDTSDLSDELRAPQYLVEDKTNTTSAKISWDRVPGAKFYSLCYAEVDGRGRRCEQGDFFKSYSTKFTVTKLKPDTEYVFRVKAHDSSNAPGALSPELRVRTRADVPSPVTNLKYFGLNASTVCIYWRPPELQNGKLKNYLVSYTTDQNWSLERLVDVNISATEKTALDGCKRDENNDVISTVLTNLSSDHTYLVMVRAENAVGLGNSPPPIIVRILDVTGGADEMNGADMVASNQRLGIILGVLISILCIMCCVAFILLRRRCLKRRALARARLDATSNYCPAAARYTTHLGTVQVRTEQPCSLHEHEIEHLVPEEHTSHIPPVTVDHLDTKGASNIPNGKILNGIHKHNGTNGNALGHIHITENPQFYAFECNGNNLSKNKSEPLLRHYEEDSNSNLKTSKFHDFYKLFDSKKFKESPYSSPCSKSKDSSLNSTQITFLDDSVTSRRLSPLLEPNG